MTLINYLTRIHFADGVLEEALRSEMERHGKRRPLVIAEEGSLVGTISERFFASFPIRSRIEVFSAIPDRITEAASREIASIYDKFDCDVLVAFGSNRAMDLAKTARIAIAHDEPISALSSEEGGGQRISNALPDLYTIPGILGFASAITDYTRVKPDEGGQVLLSSPRLLPCLTICDPTLTLGATPTDSAIAAAGIFARAIDAYLAPGFNPPAEGLALDALTRAIAFASEVLRKDLLGARREMMAGGLNSSLALQKGLCPVHAISNAVSSIAPSAIDPSILGGILIPALVRHYEPHIAPRAGRLRRSLSLGPNDDLAAGVDRHLADLPLIRTLSDLDIAADDLPLAAQIAARDRAIGNGPVRMDADDVLDVLLSAYQQAEMARASRG
ncbi:MAG: iron-containing alcohol dehydrogenase [Pseudomonadota bacterium]